MKKFFVSALFLSLALSIFSFTATKTFAGYRYFPVCQTNQDGDVYFRYPVGVGRRSRFLCDKYIPSNVVGYSGNPNNWDYHTITEYVPDQGWKLLVPRRVRWWFYARYLSEIENHLWVETVK